MQSIVMYNVIYAECHMQAAYAECPYVECRNAECRGALQPLQKGVRYDYF
jgi:hypothetical protein